MRSIIRWTRLAPELSVPADDAPAMAAAMRQAIQLGPDERAAMGGRGRALLRTCSRIRLPGGASWPMCWTAWFCETNGDEPTKRSFDVIAASLALVALLPALLAPALLVRCKLGAPVLFRQTCPAQGRASLPDAEVPLHDGRDRPRTGAALLDAQRLTAFRRRAAQHQPGRAPRAVERAEGRHEPGGPAAAADGISPCTTIGSACAMPSGPASRAGPRPTAATR